jgi:hypothetical protein
MDIDILGKSTTGTNSDPTGNDLGLGLWEPFQPTEVLDLRSFMYDNKNGRIMQEKFKNIPVMEGVTLLVFTQVPVTRDVREDPVAKTRVGFAFMNANIYNIQRLWKQNEENDLKIIEPEVTI